MSLSLESAVRTCKVITGEANRIESDRFFNPENLVCPVWNGVDDLGRQACYDSYYTKSRGCNNAEDRILVENAVWRPQYVQYHNSKCGVGEESCQNVKLNRAHANEKAANGVYGNVVNNVGAHVQAGCNVHHSASAHSASAARQAQALQHQAVNNQQQSNAGM